jgi:hypothetical protein
MALWNLLSTQAMVLALVAAQNNEVTVLARPGAPIQLGADAVLPGWVASLQGNLEPAI